MAPEAVVLPRASVLGPGAGHLWRRRWHRGYKEVPGPATPHLMTMHRRAPVDSLGTMPSVETILVARYVRLALSRRPLPGVAHPESRR